MLVSLFSCRSKENKQEFVDDNSTGKQQTKTETNSGTDNKTITAPQDSSVQKNTSNEQKKDYKNYEKTYNSVATITPLQAGDYQGKDVTVKGYVADVYQSEKVAYLNFVEKFPKNPFTAVIFANKFGVFKNIDQYKKQNVEVTGRVSLYKGKPQIILDSESQIRMVR